jgi:beta-aspartyl-dipeptidase (metallo-type)
MFQLITNGDVYTPDPRGRVDVLLAFDKIVRVGRIDRKALDAVGAEVEVIDAAGGFVVPGFLDPHQHLLGGSGEQGFATQTPEIAMSEIVCAGVTSVVGCLGVDTTMKTMAGLLAKVKGMREEKLNAYLWTGGYNVPATSVMGSVREDIMFLEECIGAGEIAIADRRGTAPGARELAKLVTDAFVGGMLGKKAGVTHFHVGELEERLAVLREMVERFDVDPCWYYVTHVERSRELMREAIQLAAEGATCDIDTAEGELHRWVRFWLDEGGDPAKLTVSSDASKSSPMKFSREVRGLVTEHGMTLDQVLPFVTTNTARVLKLEHKGALEPGKAADLVVLDRDALEVREVISLGRRMVIDGQLAVREQFLEGSDRQVTLTGEKFEPAPSLR